MRGGRCGAARLARTSGSGRAGCRPRAGRAGGARRRSTSKPARRQARPAGLVERVRPTANGTRPVRRASPPGQGVAGPDERVAGVVEGEHEPAAGREHPVQLDQRRSMSSPSSKWSSVDVDSTPSKAAEAKPAPTHVGDRHRASRRSPGLAGAAGDTSTPIHRAASGPAAAPDPGSAPRTGRSSTTGPPVADPARRGRGAPVGHGAATRPEGVVLGGHRVPVGGVGAAGHRREATERPSLDLPPPPAK